MSKTLIGLLGLGLICLGVSLDERRRVSTRPIADLNTWEGEGGSVPIQEDRIAAQTESA